MFIIMSHMIQLFLTFGSVAMCEVTTKTKERKEKDVLSKPGGCDLSVSSPCCVLWFLRVTEVVNQVLVDVEDLGKLSLRGDGGLFPVEINDDCPKGRQGSVADKT